MKVCTVGSGHVGLSTAVGLASKGNEVICVDTDEERVKKINRGEPSFYEPSLEEMLNKALEDNLIRATTNLERAVADSQIIFITVGTPTQEDGSIDLSMICESAGDIGRALQEKDDYGIVVVKSTVTPEATESEVIPRLEKESGKDAGADFGVCMNPEFLRESSAISDFLNPDRIVIGELDEKSGDKLAELYEDFDSPVLRVGLKSAEMVKYASNAFLSTKISFINELGNICKKLGIDIHEVAKGIGMDERISPRFLRAGVGYGGSCLPKDVKALTAKAISLGYDPKLLKATTALNEEQPLKALNALKKHLGELKGKTIGVLGLSFKPGTGDIRKAPALRIVGKLLENDAKVKAYDPKAIENFKQKFPDINYCEYSDEVLESDATVILTEWKEFRGLDYSGKIVIDGRGIEKAREADVYEGVCW